MEIIHRSYPQHVNNFVKMLNFGPDRVKKC